MEKKSMGKYMLVFEPKYVTYQYAVYFTEDGSVQVRKINKYSDTYYDSKSGKKVKKNLLGDIDRVMAPLENVSDFFDQYIDHDIFRYSGNNLHKMFIGYKQNERMRSLDYVVNNREIFNQLEFVEGSKITDQTRIGSLISLMADKESSFVNFINQSDRDKACNISTSTLNLINRFKYCSNMLNHDCGESELFEEYNYFYDTLKERLTSYREFREVFLLKQKYIDDLERQKEDLKNARDMLSSNMQTNNPFSQQVVQQECEQLSLFDLLPSSNQVIKSKKMDK